jgi:hypothetical protein
VQLAVRPTLTTWSEDKTLHSLDQIYLQSNLSKYLTPKQAGLRDLHRNCWNEGPYDNDLHLVKAISIILLQQFISELFDLLFQQIGNVLLVRSRPRSLSSSLFGTGIVTSRCARSRALGQIGRVATSHP